MLSAMLGVVSGLFNEGQVWAVGAAAAAVLRPFIVFVTL